jgi:hypothetical protein
MNTNRIPEHGAVPDRCPERGIQTMNKLFLILPGALLGAALTAQTVAIFPDEYVNVAEGPNNSANIPLATGTARVMCLYEQVDLQIPSGRSITKIGFRQDATLTTLDTGRTVQLEILMGYSANTAANMVSNFDNNYVAPPVTVFGPANLVLPNLRDAANPLANGQFFITLTTPFVYTPGANNLVIEYRCTGNSGGGTQWNYRLDRADFYSPVVYGPAGCPHSGGGTPSLSLTGFRPGQTFSASVSSGPGSSFAVLLIAPAQQMVAPFSLQPLIAGINPACMGQINFAAAGSLSGLTSTSGARSWSFSVPNDPSFNDMFISAQAAFIDTFAPGGVVVSRGGQVQIGVNPRSSVIRGNGPPSTVTTGTVTRNYCPVAFFEHQ